MIILGIDSAVGRTGWALVEREERRERLISHGVLDAVDGDVVADFAGRVATRELAIEVVVIEDVYFGVNVATVKVLSRLVGRWQQAFEGVGLTTRLVMADTWQLGLLRGLITGRTAREGRKRAARLWAQATFKEALGEDAADAAGLATWELRQRAFVARAV